MGSIRYSHKVLESLCVDAFEKFGFSKEEAEQITDVLILADLYNVRSHGTQRIARYHKSIENGAVKVGAKPEIVFETPVSAVIDGHSGMGQLVSVFAMKKAIEKAKKSGVGIISVRNSNHYGIAGYYAKMACDEGLIGMSATNSESICVHTNSKEALLGSNPIAFAFPAEPYPFWFDAATTVVPRGKLEVYGKEDKPLADGWATDENGDVCTDAEHVLKCISDENSCGGILPVGGKKEETGSHKGYGYSMICEIMCSILSLGNTSNHLVREKGHGTETCHSFVAVNPEIFGDANAIKEHLSVFLQELRDAKRADENVPIYTHGEKELRGLKKYLEEGIDVNINTVSEMINMCNYLGIDSTKYLGEVDISNAKQSSYEKEYK